LQAALWPIGGRAGRREAVMQSPLMIVMLVALVVAVIAQAFVWSFY
jgi:hypothetical protein